MPRTWVDKGKGKARRDDPAPEGPGGAEGIVLPLDVSGSGVFDIAYTLKVRVATNNQELSLQIDTGSSDLWIASTDCTSSICKQMNGHSYDPSSSSTPTSSNFFIQYLQGSVGGPIVWDRFEVGGYEIENQALSAANNITSEPLSTTFSGLLGLALPLNSIIADLIPPGTSDAPDGAVWASNLFSITPSTSAPAAPFLSLSLSRPGSSTVPSTLGIGRHPAELVPDPSKVDYYTIVSESGGSLFWKVDVRAITVYVAGERMPVQLGRSNSGGVFPTAVLDTGVPLLLTTSKVANAIYGAIGVDPGSDGQYYVPCTTPLNMTITLDDRPELPLHPLDLTAEPPQGNNVEYCIGLIQAADGLLTQPGSLTGDIILGVPFMRNVYTVMAYNVPDANGTFPSFSVDTTNTTSSDPGTGGNTAESLAEIAAAAPIQPRLGLMSLTDPTIALDEFNRVRVLNQPISGDSPSATASTDSGGKTLSVGLIVLIAVVAFFGLCFTGFAIRWWVYRRRYRAGNVGPSAIGAIGVGAGRGGDGEKGRHYLFARRSSKDSPFGVAAFVRKTLGQREGEGAEDVTMSSTRTRVGDDTSRPGTAGKEGAVADTEIGYRRTQVSSVDMDFDPYADHHHDFGRPGSALAVAWADGTLVGSGGRVKAGTGRDDVHLADSHHDLQASNRDNEEEDHDDGMVTTEEDGIPSHVHQRTASEAEAHQSAGHGRNFSVVVPLLGATEEDYQEADADEFGEARMRGSGSMAGVGTALRSARVRQDGHWNASASWRDSAGERASMDGSGWRGAGGSASVGGSANEVGHNRRLSVSMPLLSAVDVDEFGGLSGAGGSESMAGVGTARRSGRDTGVGD